MQSSHQFLAIINVQKVMELNKAILANIHASDTAKFTTIINGVLEQREQLSS